MLRVAAVQPKSRNLDVEGNLRRAESLVAVAAERGAQLVLCPELMAAGYVYHLSMWNVAEPRGGPTEVWLARMARQHRLYIGATYLEARGDDFFNTFSLLKPNGDVAGRVSKESLPGFEGCFFRSCFAPKVIETEFGRVGIGICHDNETARFMNRMALEQVDILLMPHSAPRISMGPLPLIGERARQMLRVLASYYAEVFGVPTVMANKAAEDSSSPVPWVPLVRLRLHFFGQSTICNGDGKVCDQLGEEEGVAVANVLLDADRKRRPTLLPSGYWSRPHRRFSQSSAALFRLLEVASKAAYGLSRSRRVATQKCCRDKG